MRLPICRAAWRRVAAGLLYSTVFHAALMVALGLWLVPELRPEGGPLLRASFRPMRDSLAPERVAAAYVVQTPSALPAATANLVLGSASLPMAVAVPDVADIQEPSGGWFGPIDDAELGQPYQVGGGGSGESDGSADFLGVRLEGTSFVFVVDRSGSMRGQRFVRAKNELRRTIASLHSDQSYYVIFFSDGPLPMPARDLVSPTPENLRLLEKWLRRVDCGGDTNPLAALELAIALRPHAIYMLSDGEFDPRIPKAIAARQGSQPVPIHTIGFVSREGEPMLRELAADSGGSYRFVP